MKKKSINWILAGCLIFNSGSVMAQAAEDSDNQDVQNSIEGATTNTNVFNEIEEQIEMESEFATILQQALDEQEVDDTVDSDLIYALGSGELVSEVTDDKQARTEELEGRLTDAGEFGARSAKAAAELAPEIFEAIDAANFTGSMREFIANDMGPYAPLLIEKQALGAMLTGVEEGDRWVESKGRYMLQVAGLGVALISGKYFFGKAPERLRNALTLKFNDPVLAAIERAYKGKVKEILVDLASERSRLISEEAKKLKRQQVVMSNLDSHRVYLHREKKRLDRVKADVAKQGAKATDAMKLALRQAKVDYQAAKSWVERSRKSLDVAIAETVAVSRNISKIQSKQAHPKRIFIRRTAWKVAKPIIRAVPVGGAAAGIGLYIAIAADQAVDFAITVDAENRVQASQILRQQFTQRIQEIDAQLAALDNAVLDAEVGNMSPNADANTIMEKASAMKNGALDSMIDGLKRLK